MTSPADEAGSTTRPWKRPAWLAFAARFAIVLAVGLCPWPGLSRGWTDGYCSVLGAMVPAVFPGETAQFRFKVADDPALGETTVPWRMYVYAQHTATGAVDRFWKDERLTFVSMLTFVALAFAQGSQRRGTIRMLGMGLSALLAVAFLDDLNLLVLTLARWRWISLSPPLAVVLSAAHTLVDGLPSMTYVIPALIWAAVR